MFAGNLVTLATGLVFNILIARNLEPATLGVWFFIGSVIPYFQILEKTIPYWAGRDIPRGVEVGRTTVLFNLLLSLPITLIFIILSNVLAATIDTEPQIILLSALLLPVYYAVAALTAVTYSTEPHKLALRTIIIDGVKIPLAVVLLPFGLAGVIAAVLIGNVAYAVYLYGVSRKHLTDRFSFEWLKKAARRIWLPLHENFIAYLSTATDSVIVGVFLSSEELSRYGIGVAIASVVGTSKALTGAIYPKLLQKGRASVQELSALFKFQHIFVTPLVAGGVVLAVQLVEIFGTRYLGAAPLLPYLLLAPALSLLGLTMRSIITGLETVDKSHDNAELVKSTLFTTQLPNYLYLGTLVVATVLTVNQFGIIGAAAARLAASITSLVPMVYFYRKNAPVSTVLHGLEKTIPAAVAMMVVLYLVNPRGTVFTLGSIVLGGLVYFSVLLAVDRDSRDLTKRAVEEARKIILPSGD